MFQLCIDRFIKAFGTIRMDNEGAIRTKHDTIGILRRFGSEDDPRQHVDGHVNTHDTDTFAFRTIDGQTVSGDRLIVRIQILQGIHPTGFTFFHGFRVPLLLGIGRITEGLRTNDLQACFRSVMIGHEEFPTILIIIRFHRDGTA